MVGIASRLSLPLPMASVILSAARTPVGSFGGALSTVPAPSLGATAITGAHVATELICLWGWNHLKKGA